MKSTAKLSSALAFALLCAAPRDARGYENQWHFGGGVGAATFAKTDSGLAPALGVHASYDLSDMFDARVELLASQHDFVETESTRFYSVAAGIMYKVDVIEWVPYVGLTGGYYAFDGRVWPRPLQKHELGISVPLGIDYTFSRSFGVGAQLRYHGFMSDPMSSLGDAPFFTALLRAEYRAGW
jgi:Outer membrane protein beta-barrel domain